MNKEVYHEGWLIKSPPTKRIWRARWRRRWFTLKQGEIPGQFCLEYYTDRNCRKLKGVIDLDQCEQVDCGLRMEHRKQKFQNMFDVKTPRRTFYLAAESEEDMHDWVNCICQVCNLQDLTKQTNDRQYYNVGAEALQNKPSENAVTSFHPSTSRQSAAITAPVDLNNSKISESVPATTTDITYQNDDFAYRNSMYSNRETMLCDAKYATGVTAPINETMIGSGPPNTDYYNFLTIANEASKIQTIERSQSMKVPQPFEPAVDPLKNHSRAQSLIEHRQSLGFTRKIPENLNLTEQFGDGNGDEPSPALSTSSGPYIPISECFSGSPVHLENDGNPATPLNSLDPKFYDTPSRSHINIGLNLTNDQPYSPKRNNYLPTRPRSGRSSPTDSESVFTDDEDWTHPSAQGPIDRNLRPSDSSVENDSIVFTYAQRFSKIPDDNARNMVSEVATPSDTGKETSSGPVRPPKRISALHLEGIEERNKDTQSSDTENASPAIGPKDISCCVEDCYDIPRSHHLPYYNVKNISPSQLTHDDEITTSAPNIISDTLTRKRTNRSHFYSNAAPSRVDGNVFRYDFIEQENAPIVNRDLKPKVQIDDKVHDSDVGAHQSDTLKMVRRNTNPSSNHIDIRPPCIDRKLKPNIPKFDTNSLRRQGGAMSVSLSSDLEFMANHPETLSKTLPRNYNNSSISTLTVAKATSSTTAAVPSQPHKLEYFELDHSNPPPICSAAGPLAGGLSSSVSFTNNAANASASTTNLSNLQRYLGPGGSASGKSTSDIFQKFSGIEPVSSDESGIVYKSVDFIKTEAIKRTRQDRAQNHSLFE